MQQRKNLNHRMERNFTNLVCLSSFIVIQVIGYRESLLVGSQLCNIVIKVIRSLLSIKEFVEAS